MIRGACLGSGSAPRPFASAGAGRSAFRSRDRRSVLAGRDGAVYVVFRDFERGDGIFVAISKDPDRAGWGIRELYAPPVGLWEPAYDPVAWQRDGQLHLFVQRVGQGDGETLEELPPQPVSILEWVP